MYYYLGRLEKCIERRETKMGDIYSTDYLTASRRVRDMRILKRVFLIVGPTLAAVGAFVIVAVLAIIFDNPSNTDHEELAFLLGFALFAIVMGGIMITLALTIVRKSIRKNERILKMEHM